MARPLLVPVAFATLLFASPTLAAEPAAPVAPVAPALVEDVTELVSLDADPEPEVGPLAPEATRAAGNARLPLYDSACMQSKAPMVCKK